MQSEPPKPLTPTPSLTPTSVEQFVPQARVLRAEIKSVAEKVWALRYPEARRAEHVNRLSEMSANVMLAYRHLEDAAMRLGKAIQAADGGVSVYDKAETTSTPEGPPEPGAGAIAAASVLTAGAGAAGLI